MVDVVYEPTATGLLFHNSEAKVKAIAGSPGSGKSVACAWEIMYLSMRQPIDNNGIRRSRVGVIRTTYPELKKTTRKTITDWLPPNSGKITNSAPMEGIIRFRIADGTTVEIDYQFLALDTEDDLKKLDSLELSFIYLNEANHMKEMHFIKCLERIGRFPSPKDGVKCLEPTVIIDFNLPGKTHWLHKYLVEKDFVETPLFTKSQVRLFIQPPAVFCDNVPQVDRNEEQPIYRMNDKAENLHNLPDGYYDLQLAMNTWSVTKARLLMLWTDSKQGKVIHPEFNRDMHIGKNLEIIDHEPVFIGFDSSGVHPCAVLTQFVKGQLRVYREVFGGDSSIDDFAEGSLLPALARWFPRSETLAIADPANARTGNKTGGLLKPTQILQDQYNIRTVIAPGANNMDVRIGAMSRVLRKINGIIIDSSCKMLIEGLDSKYVFKSMKGGDGELVYLKKKLDNKWGHYVDSLQNVAVFIHHQNGTGASNTFKVKKRRLL